MWAGACPRLRPYTRQDMAALDRSKIEEGVRLILAGIGDDPRRDGVADTPRRVADMYEEVFAGIGADPIDLVTVIKGAAHDEMSMVTDIPLSTSSEHRLVPFTARAQV